MRRSERYTLKNTPVQLVQTREEAAGGREGELCGHAVTRRLKKTTDGSGLFVKATTPAQTLKKGQSINARNGLLIQSCETLGTNRLLADFDFQPFNLAPERRRSQVAYSG